MATKKRDRKEAPGRSGNVAGGDTAGRIDTGGDRIPGSSSGPAFNIKFYARRTWDKGKKKVLHEPAPVERIKTPEREIVLPPADFQTEYRLFYHPDAGEIIKLFPYLYKRVIQRGKN